MKWTDLFRKICGFFKLDLIPYTYVLTEAHKVVMANLKFRVASGRGFNISVRALEDMEYRNDTLF